MSLNSALESGMFTSGRRVARGDHNWRAPELVVVRQPRVPALVAGPRRRRAAAPAAPLHAASPAPAGSAFVVAGPRVARAVPGVASAEVATATERPAAAVRVRRARARLPSLGPSAGYQRG